MLSRAVYFISIDGVHGDSSLQSLKLVDNPIAK